MALDEFFGCLLTSFGVPMVLVAFTVLTRPLRIITFIISASFWLVSLLASSIVWFAVVPLREKLAFGLVLSVLFQEGARLLFLYYLHKLSRGIERLSVDRRSTEVSSLDHSIVSGSGEEAAARLVSGDHNSVNRPSSVFNVTAFAYVGGLGFGIATGLFSALNLLVALRGPGTLGLYDQPSDFICLYALQTLFIILNQTASHVIMSKGYEKRSYIKIGLVVIFHMLYSCLTLANGYPNPVPQIIISINCLICVALCCWAFKEAGGQARKIPWAMSLNFRRLNRFMRHSFRSRSINRSI